MASMKFQVEKSQQEMMLKQQMIQFEMMLQNSMADGVIDAQDQAYGGYGHDKHRNEFDLRAGDTNIHGNEVVMDSPMYDADSPMNDPNFWENYNNNNANGGRIGMNTYADGGLVEGHINLSKSLKV